MPQVPIIMPQLGESIAEATVVHCHVKIGELVAEDQEVMTVETNKATLGVVSPCRGKMERLLAELNQSYAVGSVLAYLETSEEEARRRGLQGSVPPRAAEPSPESHPSQPAASSNVEPRVRGLPVPANAAGAGFMSPRMKARMHELGLHAADMAGIPGSGAGSRVTIDDLEKFLAGLERNKTSPASSMRVAVADAMRRSWTRPLATVGLRVCLDPVLAHRKSCLAKPGPTCYALRALAIALAENSAPAGRLVGTRIVHPPAIDIGFAVEADDGVLVPVLRRADSGTFKELTARYNELVESARQRKLPAGATGGSIATVTNFGSFGLDWATPIPLPEQTLVLGLGAGHQAPWWDAAQRAFVPITEANLTLSFDHRVLDGGGAGRLLTRITSLLSQPGSL